MLKRVHAPRELDLRRNEGGRDDAGAPGASTVTTDKRVLLIAGPNGAGKTTFATEFLPNEADCPVFVNADLIAAGLSPFRPDSVAVKACRIMLSRIREHAARGESFALETTLSGHTYAKFIPRWREQGYRVTLFFLRLPTPEAAVTRVRQRVTEGGHDVPEMVARRRFHAGRHNWESVYKGLVDEWAEYDNSGHTPMRLAEEAQRVSPLDASVRKQATPRRSALLAGAEAAMRRADRRAHRRAREIAGCTQGIEGSEREGTTQAVVTIRNPAAPDRFWTALFLVDATATDSLVPRPRLEAIGLRPRSRRTHERSHGQEATVAITTADIEFMGETVGGTILFGDAHAEPVLGATALASAGIEVEPNNQRLTKLPAVRLKKLREHS